MFCYQCEQTLKGIGCDKIGVCGKQTDVAELQDVLEHELRGLSYCANEARKKGVVDPEADAFVADSLFSTLTNVNFDSESFAAMINRASALREALCAKAGVSTPAGVKFLSSSATKAEMAAMAPGCAIKFINADEDIRSLIHTTMYGLKGVAAYAHHARTLGREDAAVYADIHASLAAMLDSTLTLTDWVGLTLKCGATNLRVMEMLDEANTTTYGHPEITQVSLGARKGKAILVSGHDLKDLEAILKQTEGKGINVYTHGEMLPCNAYPGLKKYAHLAGHYGTAWQNQHHEFAEFPGSIVMTTNCIQKPTQKYMDHIFTSGPVQWPGVVHIAGTDFSPAIAKALEMPGFEADVAGKTVLAGFGRNTVMSVAGKVIEAVKNKDIRHFFLVGGCDGARPGRSYYSDFVDKVPKDCVVLTLACGKFRFFDKEMGDIGGIPRLLDIGQCNDAYSAIKIAVALAEAFGVGVNELPLSMVLSWYEQKAVAILLTLLHLGIKDIRLGPSLPAFITPNVLQVLVDNFAIKPITTPDEDLKAILG